MARGKHEEHNPNRQVGRANFFNLDKRGNIGVTWEGGDHEGVPLSELRHADESSSMYGKKVSKTHLQKVAKKNNEANMFSTNDVQVMRDL